MGIFSGLKFKGTILAAFLLTTVIMTKSTQSHETYTSRGDSSVLFSNVSQSHKISSPAAVYCTDMGYEYHVISDGAGGQTDTCTMPDGAICSAWDFLEGKCGQAHSYCARQGFDELTATDGKNPFSYEYAVCIDKTGKIIDSVTTLDNLDTKLNHCGATTESQGTDSNNPQVPGTSPSDKPFVDLGGTPPSSWDWRNATYNSIAGNWTSPVKNQGNCGSCWAFAAVGQTEAVLNLAAGNPNLDKDLAEEYLVSDCSSAGSCCGGWHSSALSFILNQGIPDEACLPYASGSCGCSGSCSCTYNGGSSCANTTCSQRCSDYNNRLSKLDSYGSVNPNKTDIKNALITYGPLSVAIDVGEGDNYWDPATHVFKCSNPPQVDHAVVIVGYDDAGGYWIVKNSWGSTWNGDGFFKVGYGQCLIENYVYYAHAASSKPGAFNKTSPANAAVDQLPTPTLSWGTALTAASYEYCYDTTNDSLCSGTWTSTGTLTSTTLSGLKRYTTYYWQVRAVNTSGMTYANSGSWWSFRTVPITSSFQSVGTYDGWIRESTSTSGMGGSLNTTAETLTVGDDTLNRQLRSILSFDTSSLPDTAVITQVQVKVMKKFIGGTNPFTILGGLNVDITKPNFGTTVGLVVTDFQAAAGMAGAGTFGATPIGGWYIVSLASSAYPFVNLTGTTQVRLLFATDSNNNSVADYVQFYSGDAVTAANRPLLFVRYYLP